GSQIEFKRTTESLSGPHLSKLRNPLIAETFHRTGAVEVWGRGTNRVIDECIRWGIEPPKTGVSTRSIERNLQQLILRGRLKRIGPDKGGHWEVTK
ncbi:MAG: ATP-binding protein, partial [Myxococcota bacterium]